MAAKKRARRAKAKATHFLSAEEILNADDIKTELVHVPEWGGSLYVRTMNGFDRDEYDQAQYAGMQAQKEAGAADGDLVTNLRARTIAFSACDEGGKRLFTVAQVEKLGRKSGAALDRVWTVARRVNKLSKEDVAELSGNS